MLEATGIQDPTFILCLGGRGDDLSSRELWTAMTQESVDEHLASRDVQGELLRDIIDVWLERYREAMQAMET